jgi:hypothetical protein
LTAQTEEPASAASSGSELLRVYGFMDFGLDKFFMGNADDGVGLLRPTPARACP